MSFLPPRAGAGAAVGHVRYSTAGGARLAQQCSAGAEAASVWAAAGASLELGAAHMEGLTPEYLILKHCVLIQRCVQKPAFHVGLKSTKEQRVVWV